MTRSGSLAALAGMADVPSVLILASLVLWPYHLALAMGAMDSALELSGYGPVTIAIQALALLALFGAAPVVFRSRRFGRTLKLAYLPTGYPVVVGLTNVVPALL